MSQVFTAKQICERALRAINAFPTTESAADGEQLREAMTWLDLILAQNAGTNKLFFLVQQLNALQFTIQNGKGSYDLLGALGANAPIDGLQDPIAAYLLIPSGSSVVGFTSSVSGVVVGAAAIDTTNPAAVPPGSTVTAVNLSTNQVTLSGPSTVAAGDSVQFGASPTLTSTGTVNGQGMVAGTSFVRRRPIELVTRETFEARRLPSENGHPHMAYIDRVPDSQLYLHPIPLVTDTGLYVFNLDAQAYAPNVAPAGVTGTQAVALNATKFRQAWQRYLVLQLSHDLGSGPIFKLPEASLNRFGKAAGAAKTELLAFENQEHDDEPPIGEAFDGDHYDSHERDGARY